MGSTKEAGASPFLTASYSFLSFDPGLNDFQCWTIRTTLKVSGSGRGLAPAIYFFVEASTVVLLATIVPSGSMIA